MILSKKGFKDMYFWKNSFFCLFLSLTLAPLMGKSQEDSIPRPEHPQPQAVRKEWLNLNGAWEFLETDDVETSASIIFSDAPYQEKIIVPFCRESRLSGIHRREFVKNVFYRRAIQIPKQWASQRTLLHIGACDWKTRVRVNDQIVGEHVGGSASFSFDITKALKKGDNTILIHAFDDTVSGKQALGKQCPQKESFGCHYTPTTGIWQTVWLEGAGASFINSFRIDTNTEQKKVLIQADIEGSLQDLVMEAVIYAEGKKKASVKIPVDSRNASLIVYLKKQRIWSVSDPYLYDLRLTLYRKNRIVDQVTSYFGIRKLKIEGGCILINDEPVFQRLILDQGFYPDGIWTAPSDEALKQDILLSKACGFNGARLHQKVFDPRFHFWADKLGYITWGEFPDWGATIADPAIHNDYIREWVEVIARDRDHPSIIGWCPFNERTDPSRDLIPTVYNLTRALDPSRPVMDTSGYIHSVPDPMLLDAHDYTQEPDVFREKYPYYEYALPERYEITAPSGIPFFVSEFGGTSWDVNKGWGYGNQPKSLEEFYTRFEGLCRALMDNRHIFGFCYTQLTDVEQEQNGMYYYDRKPKFDVSRIHDIVSGKTAYEQDPPLAIDIKQVDWKILIGSRHDGESAGEWRYTTDSLNIPENWFKSKFDDSGWKKGYAPFGKKGGWEDKIRTPWDTKDLWLRQGFVHQGEDFDTATIVMHYDNQTTVYLNGKKILTKKRWNDRYESFDVTGAVQKALKKGKNIIAVHIHQDEGGQYLDLALLVGELR